MIENPYKLPFLIFDFPDASGEAFRLYFEKPRRVVVARSLCEVIPALEEVENEVNFGAVAAGFIAYEAASAFDPALKTPPPSKLPLLWFGIFDTPSPLPETTDSTENYPLYWEPNRTKEEYRSNFLQIKEALRAGESYQVNYAMRLRSLFTGDSLAFYERMRNNQSGSYSAYLDIGKFKILSCSPELFFERRGSRIETKPMKGTIRRGRTPEEDDKLREELSGSEKNRAENLMIVDLLRNDIGRIAVTGSVKVENLFRVETYPTFHAMTSAISAELPENVSLIDILKALFPCGSVTGAPKISTMRLIAELEEEPRQVYCGAIGLLTRERAVFNVAIRTALIDSESGIAEYGAGGGIVWDSQAEEEYEEALLKSQALTLNRPNFELTEAMLLRNGELMMPDRHLSRMQKSAQYFSFQYDENRANATLNGALQQVKAASCEAEKSFKIRLLLSKAGDFRAEAIPLPTCPATEGDNRYALANYPVSSEDVFLFHKTTHRKVYAERAADFPEVCDVLLWNERGELTEFTRGNLVLQLKGELWTPPVACGLLAGTLREELLETGAIRERVLHKSDLESAEEVWFINSIRGWVRLRRENEPRKNTIADTGRG